MTRRAWGWGPAAETVAEVIEGAVERSDKSVYLVVDGPDV